MECCHPGTLRTITHEVDDGLRHIPSPVRHSDFGFGKKAIYVVTLARTQYASGSTQLFSHLLSLPYKSNILGTMDHEEIPPPPARFAQLKRDIAESYPDFEAKATKAWSEIIGALGDAVAKIEKEGSNVSSVRLLQVEKCVDLTSSAL